MRTEPAFDLRSRSCHCSAPQGLCVMLVFTVFNSEFKEAWRVACLGKKSPGEDPQRPPQNTVSSHTNRLYIQEIQSSCSSSHPSLNRKHLNSVLTLPLKHDCMILMGYVNESVTSLATFSKATSFDIHLFIFSRCTFSVPPLPQMPSCPPLHLPSIHSFISPVQHLSSPSAFGVYH